MSTCLDDRELLELREDDAPPAARAHLVACVPCARRAAHLDRDLALLTRVLRDAPIPSRAPAAPPRWLVPGVSAAAALAGALLVWIAQPSSDGPPRAAPLVAAPAAVDAEERRLREVSRALFALDPLDPVVQLRRQSELGHVQAALGGAHPCERRSAACEW